MAAKTVETAAAFGGGGGWGWDSIWWQLLAFSLQQHFCTTSEDRTLLPVQHWRHVVRSGGVKMLSGVVTTVGGDGRWVGGGEGDVTPHKSPTFAS